MAASYIWQLPRGSIPRYLQKMTVKIPEDEKEQYTGDNIKELISINLLNPEIIVTYSDKHTESISASFILLPAV